MNIKIRKAMPTIEEGRIYAGFLDVAAEGFFKGILGENAYEYIAQAFLSEDSSYSYKTASFVESDSQIVGMVSGYSTSDKEGFKEQSLRKLIGKSNIRLWMFSIVEIFLSNRMGPKGKGDFYIQAIAVDEKMRGHGVGKQLMEYIENRARKEGNTSISLDVSSKNSKAISLYEKRGMIKDSYWPKRPSPHFLTRMKRDFNLQD